MSISTLLGYNGKVLPRTSDESVDTNGKPTSSRTGVGINIKVNAAQSSLLYELRLLEQRMVYSFSTSNLENKRQLSPEPVALL